MLCLTLSCRSTWAPPESSSRTTAVLPQRLALMRAVMPLWGTQSDKTVTIACDVTHIETRWKVYTCCEAVNDTSISLAYLSTWTYKSSREEGTLLIISLMSNIRVEGANELCQYLSSRRGREGSLIERMHFSHTFLVLNGTFFTLQTFKTPALGAETTR